ncbi:UNVERIFIED_CONTAM: hypothetical protein ABIC26_002135 [Paenibacillus sp. PvR008]
MNMNEQIKQWNEEAQANNADHPHRKVELFIEVRDEALEAVVPYLKQRNYRHVTLVEDEHTSAAAGEKVAQLIRDAGLVVHVVRLPPNAAGDVIADEGFIVKVLLGVEDESQAVLVVGSGTIHDLVRFACYKMNRPFLSVPTAASVDGFTSAGAPLIVGGSKQTFQAVPPEAIFADLSVLLHGAKVSVTSALLADLYRDLATSQAEDAFRVYRTLPNVGADACMAGSGRWPVYDCRAGRNRGAACACTPHGSYPA